jgi:hypothetical protein
MTNASSNDDQQGQEATATSGRLIVVYARDPRGMVLRLEGSDQAWLDTSPDGNRGRRLGATLRAVAEGRAASVPNLDPIPGRYVDDLLDRYGGFRAVALADPSVRQVHPVRPDEWGQAAHRYLDGFVDSQRQRKDGR